VASTTDDQAIIEKIDVRRAIHDPGGSQKSQRCRGHCLKKEYALLGRLLDGQKGETKPGTAPFPCKPGHSRSVRITMWSSPGILPEAARPGPQTGRENISWNPFRTQNPCVMERILTSRPGSTEN